MRVLIIGGGGREHALAELALRSPQLSALFVAPGNAGTAAHNVALNVNVHPEVVAFCDTESIDLVVIGPEVPLVAGLADRLTEAGVACFGPSAAAAQLEGSKAFTRKFAAQVGVAQPHSAAFRDAATATAWFHDFGAPVVVKADGLAAGKGVVIPDNDGETVAAIDDMFAGAFGESSETVVLEERMTGEELSLFAITDGTTVVPLAVAQDHKRVGDGDTGLNTGGMGAFTPVPGVGPAAVAALSEQFVDPVVRGMAEQGTPYVGVLFAGLMVTPEGPKLVEYNCRFGDPEAEVILPLVIDDGLELLHAAATGRLGELQVHGIADRAAATVVVAADGYPTAPTKGIEMPTAALAAVAADDQAMVFHAGTALDSNGQLVSSGGRVLAITGLGVDLDAALAAAYDHVDEITQTSGLFARTDIGWRHAPRPTPRSS